MSLCKRIHSLRTTESVNHTNHVDELDRGYLPVFKQELYNRAGDGNRVRTLISILFYVIYFNLFVECFGCLRFFQIDWQSQPSPWTLVDKCSCSNARFSNSDMRVSSVSSFISMDS